jgi:hypothetical protein
MGLLNDLFGIFFSPIGSTGLAAPPNTVSKFAAEPNSESLNILTKLAFVTNTNASLKLVSGFSPRK